MIYIPPEKNYELIEVRNFPYMGRTWKTQLPLYNDHFRDAKEMIEDISKDDK
jgi:hypothetical protein